jgi:hypothetical protein
MFANSNLSSIIKKIVHHDCFKTASKQVTVASRENAGNRKTPKCNQGLYNPAVKNSPSSAPAAVTASTHQPICDLKNAGACAAASSL